MATTTRLPITDPDVRRKFERSFRQTEDIPDGLDTPCWLSQRKPDKDGYTNYRWNGVLYKSHRFSYMLYVAESEDIEPGMDVDHRCRRRKCVQPDHLELVTHTENMRRIAERKMVISDDHEEPEDDTPIEPEVILESIRELLADKPFEGALGIVSELGTPWRDFKDTEDFDPDNKWQRAALFLYAVECGVRPRLAARVIFNATPFAMHNWSKNDEWQKDFAEARKAMQHRRWGDYRDNWFDRAERKLRTMSADDLAKHGRIIVQKEAIDADVHKASSKGAPALTAGGNNYFLIVNGDPDKLLDQIIDSTARHIPDERPALPPPDDDEDD